MLSCRALYQQTSSFNTKFQRMTSLYLVFAVVFVCNVSPENVSPEESDASKVPESRTKRYSSFVRIGKGDSMETGDEEDISKLSEEVDTLMKMRSEVDAAERTLDVTGESEKMLSLEDDEVESQGLDKKASSFVRIGRQPYYMHRFIRIGRNGLVDAAADDQVFEEQNKRQPSFIRIGKALSNFVRFGKSQEDLTGLSPNVPGDNFQKRGFVRIGKGVSFVRFGKANHEEENGNKRASSFVRIGKNFVRIGKNSNENGDDFQNDYDAPAVSNSDLRDKRLTNFVRIGKSIENNAPQQFQNPPSEYLTQYSQIPTKRFTKFVRIGKGSKREMPLPYLDYLTALNFKNNQLGATQSNKPLSVKKRAFIRIGRLPARAFFRTSKSHNNGPNRGMSPKNLYRIGK